MSERNFHSKGVNLDASGGAITDQVVLTVPTGYKMIVTMFFLANVGGSTTTVGAKWNDGATIPFLGSKSLGAGDHVLFGGGEGQYMAMYEGDTISVSVASGGTCGLIVSYHLVRADGQKALT